MNDDVPSWMCNVTKNGAQSGRKLGIFSKIFLSSLYDAILHDILWNSKDPS